MNTENLHELINRYESKLDFLYNSEHHELFKWKAVKTWREEWNKPESSFLSFAERYTAARKDFSLFIDNSRMHPSVGVLKLWEKEPETVEQMFRELWAGEAGEDIRAVQGRMDTFLDVHESLRGKYFPGNWSYKQDRHSASVYLVMNDPETHYVFKSKDAQEMARAIDFGFDIGAGRHFSLANYYRLCETIVAALREHDSLLEKHFSRLSDAYYYDKSLHLLAFDLMYCSRTYHFYNGLVVSLTSKAKRKTEDQMTAEKLAKKDEERLARIEAILQEIDELETSTDGCEDISLIGVQVTSTQFGTGTVIEQEINRITVQFENDQKAFVLDRKFPSRPRFEDDESIVELFTAYGHAREQIKRLQKELERLQNKG